MKRTAFLATLLVLLALAAIASWWLQRQEAVPAEALDVMPPGHWVRAPRASPRSETSGEDRAQLLSLPYASGSAPAPDREGVVFHDQAQAWPGLNLYVSGHGSEVILISMEGEFLHRWRRRFEEVFPDRNPGNETDFIRRARLLDDGSLLVLYQGGGLARLDASSEVLWATPGAFFNDFDVVSDRVYLIGKTARVLPDIRPEEVLEDFIALLDLETGERLEQSPLLPAFDDSPYASLLDPLPDHPDIFHSNTMTVLDGTIPSQLLTSDSQTIFAEGNLLFSLREIDLIGVLSADLQAVLWAQRGPWKAQHEPVLLADGQVLVFDNRGGAEKRSRVLIWDPMNKAITWSFEHPSFYSRQAGVASRLPNGNTLVVSSEQGRAFELNSEGQVVWEWVSPHRAGRNDELVANLFEMQRLGNSELPWLEQLHQDS